MRQWDWGWNDWWCCASECVRVDESALTLKSPFFLPEKKYSHLCRRYLFPVVHVEIKNRRTSHRKWTLKNRIEKIKRIETDLTINGTRFNSQIIRFILMQLFRISHFSSVNLKSWILRSLPISFKPFSKTSNKRQSLLSSQMNVIYQIMCASLGEHKTMTIIVYCNFDGRAQNEAK